MVLLGALGVMMTSMPRGVAVAQTAPDQEVPGRALDGLVTRVHFDADGRSLAANGIGARVMWRASSFLRAAPAVADRLEVGLYGAHTLAREFGRPLSFSSVTLGGMADVRLLTEPVAGRVDPYLSLGAGMLRTAVDRVLGDPPSPLLDRSRTVPTLTPGAGLRVRVSPSTALQTDVRDLVTFRGDTRHNLAYGLGVRLTAF